MTGLAQLFKLVECTLHGAIGESVNAEVMGLRNQKRFIMHPDDEKDFEQEVLAEEGVVLVDGPIWTSDSPAKLNSLDRIGNYCIIWSTLDRPSLSAQYKGGEWHCDSEMATIQFLRSRIHGDLLTEGSLSISTDPATQTEARRIEKRFHSYFMHMKSNYRNSAVCWYSLTPFLPAAPGRSANPGMPDSNVWVGPHALRWLRADKHRRVRQHSSFGAYAVLGEDVQRLISGSLPTPDLS